MKTSGEIRSEFLEFFRARGHRIVKSAPVVPAGDPTLLFTNAGMNQFKDVFLGTGSREYTRCADTQKVIRASGKHNDLEDVGLDTYHHTFFEMLGNWSFGDYFKAEAIRFAHEFLTKSMGLPADRLWATVFGGEPRLGLAADTEAERLWPAETGIPAQRVLRFGMKDNFWEMGEAGPCGPCSEIHMDMGPSACDRAAEKGHVCSVNGGCRRYIEIWNLVFIQFNNAGGYSLKQLPAKHVDTGMGFERLVAAVQGKMSNYDTDVFSGLFGAIGAKTGASYGSGGRTDVAFRVIADHVRALCVAIADGAMPDRKMRGSILRSLLRRAARFARQVLGTEEPFLNELAPVVAEGFGNVFPEVGERLDHIMHVMKEEEISFSRTISRGLSRFESLAAATRLAKSRVIDGTEAFRLYHQDGFPRDLIDQMARESGLLVDETGWDKARKEHEDVSREGGVGGYRIDPALVEGLDATVFEGYWEERKDGEGQACTSRGARVLAFIEGGAMVLDRTPFYAESGGQGGDRGEISAPGFLFRVEDTGKIGDIVVHYGRLERGAASALPAEVTASVSAESRLSTAANHTATHLLHWALKKVLGPGANQQGSYVGPDRLRFDFNHQRALTRGEIREVETLVNSRILESQALSISRKGYDEAKAGGATALFGEKYGDIVRVVEVGGYSRELCGGTHVRSTGEIGLFKIIAEEGVAAGVRRIEAATGLGALDHVRKMEDMLRASAEILKSPVNSVPERLEALKKREKELSKEIEALKSRLAGESGSASGEERDVEGVRVYSAQAPVSDQKALRELADRQRKRLKSGIVAVGGAEGGKVAMIIGVTADLARRFNAAEIASKLAVHIGGKGGGKPDMAQAGGTNPSGLAAALSGVFDVVAAMAKGPAAG